MAKNKIATLDKLTYLLSGKNFTFTSGVWDGLHSGHTRYLKKARDFSGILVVGVHSDLMTKKRKGESRPHFPEEDRAEVISHLPFVDYIIILKDQDDLYKTIEELSPSVLVVSTTSEGPENNAENMKQRFGKLMKVQILEPMSDFHSSGIKK